MIFDARRRNRRRVFYVDARKWREYEHLDGVEQSEDSILRAIHTKHLVENESETKFET